MTALSLWILFKRQPCVDFLKSLCKCTKYIVNIYLCIFFLVILTEILVLLLRFFQKKKQTKKKQKRKKCPLQTEALCYSSFSVRLSGRKKDFSSWFALKNREGWEICCSKAWPATLMKSPASFEHRRGLLGPGWAPFKMAQIAHKSKQNFFSRWLKFCPFSEHGSSQWKAKRRIRDCGAAEASANWGEDDNVKSLITSCCRKPVSRPSAFSFLFLLHWLRVCSH